MLLANKLTWLLMGKLEKHKLMLRIGIGRFTTEKEIDYVIEKLT